MPNSFNCTNGTSYLRNVFNMTLPVYILIIDLIRAKLYSLQNRRFILWVEVPEQATACSAGYKLL